MAKDDVTSGFSSELPASPPEHQHTDERNTNSDANMLEKVYMIL